MRRLWVVVAVVCGGCLGSDDLIDGTFTPDQWSMLKAGLHVKMPDVCSYPMNDGDCESAARLGQALFFEPALSGNGKVSCATCHDSSHWFIDTRPQNNVSLGVMNWTSRNSSSVVNLALKYELASPRHDVFTFDGKRSSPGDVLESAKGVPMMTTDAIIASAVRMNGNYTMLYSAAFQAAWDDATVVANVKRAFNAYLWRLVSVNAPFDRWLAGDETAISDSAKRGFAVFVGRGTCFECHNGPLLSDIEFHNTGVPQVGPFVPPTDAGRNKVTMNPADIGKFLTPSLRNIAKTAPYMHDGALATLGDVIAFYRAGGVANGYSGTRDPRIVPLDISDDDAHDLEAFLVSLTGDEIPMELRGMSPPMCSSAVDQVCSGACVDTSTDASNCGGCGHVCPTGTTCTGGMCVLDTCPIPLSSCNNMCVDLQTDPMNCGMCGHSCTTYCQGGMCGGI